MSDLKKEVSELLKPLVGLPLIEIGQLLEKPPKGIDADLAFPCFSLARTFKKNPALIAQEISGNLRPRGLVKNIEAAGPYVNFYADWSMLGDSLLKDILGNKQFGHGNEKGNILVEFAHPNTHKAFHLGHVRNICLAESLCRILEENGFTVIRANYQGDIGPHVAKCLWGLTHLGLTPPSVGKGAWLGEVYSKANAAIAEDEMAEGEVREINKKLYARDKELVKLWKETRQWSLDYFDGIYKDFGVQFKRFYFESEVEGPGILLARELVKKKIAKESEGAIIMDLKKWDLGVYVLLTKDGTPLYSIKDFVLAQLQEKEFHPDKIIHVVGTEQMLHFRQLFKGLEFISPSIAKKEYHLPYELVNLPTGKMSSRQGTVVTYDELKEEMFEHALEETKKHAEAADVEQIASVIARGAIKYDMIKQSPEKVITFDWAQALSFEGNAAPYLQYTIVRAAGILEKGGIKKIGSFDAGELGGKEEITVLKKLLSFSESLSHAARDYRPHYIANYAHELATAFNDFYQNVSVLQAEEGKKDARLALVLATELVLRRALWLMGIEVPQRM